MHSLKFCVLLAVLCSSSQLGHSSVVTPKPYTIEVPQPQPLQNLAVPSPSEETDALVSENVLPAKKKTTTTTTTTTTTEATTTTTTTEPTTTPTTTSPAPTTPAPTTPVPPAPKPPGPPEQGSWSYTEQNITCIVIQFAAQLNITAPQGANYSHVIVNVPSNATVVSGSCNKTEQWLLLSWPALNISAPNNTLRLVYSVNETTKNYELKGLNLTLNPEILTNASSSDMLELWHGKSWQTPLATSYRCNQPTELKLTCDITNVAGILTVSHLQEEAYRTTAAAGFSAARDCSSGDVPDAVPIAVGCALGGLVVVVLVAYLVARRRSAAHGYLSM